MVEVVTFVNPGRQKRPRNDDDRERKLFMSSKASDLLKEVPPKPKARTQVDDDKLYFSNFDSIFQGVESLGNSQLQWKDRKKLEQRKLETKGAKPVKKPRMAPDMSLHIKRKREAEEERKRQEDLAAGNLVKRNKNKPKPRNSEDRGLQPSEGRFKGGVLYVNPSGDAKKSKRFKGKKNK